MNHSQPPCVSPPHCPVDHGGWLRICPTFPCFRVDATGTTVQRLDRGQWVPVARHCLGNGHDCVVADADDIWLSVDRLVSDAWHQGVRWCP